MSPSQEQAIYTWASTATGLATIWAREGGPRPAFPFVTIDVRSEQSVGIDETRYSAPDGNGKVVPTLCGNRRASVQIGIWNKARGYDTASPPTPGRQYLSTLRSSLRFQSVLAALAAQDIAVSNVGTSVEFDVDDGGDRWLSAAVLDVTFLYVTNAADPAPPLDTIGQVAITGTNARPDATTIAVPSDEQFPGT